MPSSVPRPSPAVTESVLPLSELSVCIPTYNRPALLQRALRSVVGDASTDIAERVEVVISDNSSDDASGRVAHAALEGWSGQSRYVRHDPGVGMIGNFNQCVKLARGRWVLILHDDDCLLPGALPKLLAGIDRAGGDRVLLFGVRVVNERGRMLRYQRSRRERSLGPAEALRRLLSNSSLVRFPAIVVRRDAYEEVGPFDDEVGGATDTDMWRRLLGRYGVRLMPVTTTAYLVHAEAATEKVFQPETIRAMDTIFGRAARQGVLSERAVRHAQRHWVHQFILAGTLRRLRARDRAGARRVMSLFALSSVRALGVSWRWLPLRLVFRAFTAGASHG